MNDATEYLIEARAALLQARTSEEVASARFALAEALMLSALSEASD